MKMVMQLNSMLARDLEVRAGEVRVSKFGLVERTSQDEREAQAHRGVCNSICPSNA